MQLVTEDNITEFAVERWGTARDPRLAELMTALVRHLHDFAREVLWFPRNRGGFLCRVSVECGGLVVDR